MLSQRLSKAALVLEVATQPDERRGRAQELRDVLALWSHAHVALQHGDPQIGLPGKNSAEIDAMFAAIDPSHQAIVREATALLAMVGADGARTPDRPMEQAVVAGILAAEPPFLTGMDKIVFQYDKEATARVERLKRIELVLLVVTLGVLLLEGLYVFRPAAREIRKTISDLVMAKGHLDKTIEALRALAGADPPA